MERQYISEKTSLSRIVQGFWRLQSWDFTAQELAYFMNACVERGVTTFDTAEIYANTECESQQGAAMAYDPTLRNKIEIVTKTGISRYKPGCNYYDTTYARVKKSCQQSLERLGAEQIDLYLIHREDPCLDPWETGRALLELKQEGLVKEIGVSNFDPHKFAALNKAVDGQLVTNQIEWSPLCFQHFDSGLMDDLCAARVHPMIWSPLAGGRLFDAQDEQASKTMGVLAPMAEEHGVSVATLVYAWMLYHPVGAMPIVGSHKLERLDDAIAALDVKLEHREWYDIYRASGQQILR